MKIVFALDSWKGSLSAREACEAVAAGYRELRPEVTPVLCPMADGGEGTLELLAAADPGEQVMCRVCGPLWGKQVEVSWLWWPERKTAWIEMARCAGLTLLRPEERDPLRTTTFGVGELIADAIRHGVEHITLAVGGSATVDGGVGAASALGWTFLDKNGSAIPLGGGGLRQLERIVPPRELLSVRMDVLCDVTNPLLGDKGAVAVFGPQKGASPEALRLLEEGLSRLADISARDLGGSSCATTPGAGAAGGLSYGMMIFGGARLVSGVDILIERLGVGEALAGADGVVTGEGCLDTQSLQGKVVAGVLSAAQKAGVPVAVVAGTVTLDSETATHAGISLALQANDQNLPLADALKRASGLARNAGHRLAARFP